MAPRRRGDAATRCPLRSRPTLPEKEYQPPDYPPRSLKWRRRLTFPRQAGTNGPRSETEPVAANVETPGGVASSVPYIGGALVHPRIQRFAMLSLCRRAFYPARAVASPALVIEVHRHNTHRRQCGGCKSSPGLICEVPLLTLPSRDLATIVAVIQGIREWVAVRVITCIGRCSPTARARAQENGVSKGRCGAFYSGQCRKGNKSRRSARLHQRQQICPINCRTSAASCRQILPRGEVAAVVASRRRGVFCYYR